MATFGKIIGGGMPVGAFGASKAIMSRLAPDGDTYQAGTLSGNPVAMAAGIATLDILDRESAWVQLESARRAAGKTAGAHRRHRAVSPAPGAPGLSAVAVVAR